MKKRALAIKVGVTERSISAYEGGAQIPEQSTLTKISSALRFPEAFFFGDDPEVPTPDVASFRSMSKMTASLRDSALGAGAIALLLNGWLEQRFELPKADVPDFGSERGDLAGFDDLKSVVWGATSNKGPEAIAEMLRSHWGMGEQPIKNMIGLLESKGVRVYSLSIDSKEVDAFSLWNGGTPFVFLNTFKSAERCRFDAAHELGHLIMHQHAHPQGPDLEREANAFASAFLMPRASVLAKAPATATLQNLIKYKKIWAVSVAALNYRMHSLDLTSDWAYRTLCIQISQEGYRNNEPESILHERSIILEKIFASLRAEGVSKTDIARELSIDAEEIDELTFCLMLNALKGNSSILHEKKRSVATLQLVK